MLFETATASAPPSAGACSAAHHSTAAGTASAPMAPAPDAAHNRTFEHVCEVIVDGLLRVVELQNTEIALFRAVLVRLRLGRSLSCPHAREALARIFFAILALAAPARSWKRRCCLCFKQCGGAENPADYWRGGRRCCIRFAAFWAMRDYFRASCTPCRCACAWPKITTRLPENCSASSCGAIASRPVRLRRTAAKTASAVLCRPPLSYTRHPHARHLSPRAAPLATRNPCLSPPRRSQKVLHLLLIMDKEQRPRCRHLPQGVT